MPVEVNTAALEAVLEATKQHIKLREALSLHTQTWVLGEYEPVELDTCVAMLQQSLDSELERERLK